MLPNARALIPTGLKIGIPKGYEIQVRPRSGLAIKHGITCLNTPGTIDSDYRGEVGVILINLSDTPFTITRAMRIAQLVIAPVTQIAWREVSALDDTDRGTGVWLKSEFKFGFCFATRVGIIGGDKLILDGSGKSRVWGRR